MSQLDPAITYQQEAAELLDRLENILLDLGQARDDRALVDAAFRALHTIKGSGAMFGFDAVAAFTHDFETAFDRVRQGEAAVTDGLITVALAAKDHIRALIDHAEEHVAPQGATILDELRSLVAGAAAPHRGGAPAAGSAEAVVAAAQTGWQIDFTFAPHVLRNGTDPLGLLDELRALGPCTVLPCVDNVPDLTELDPQELHFGWTVTLEAPVARSAIEDVFMFVIDDMALELKPPAPAPIPEASVATPRPAPEAAPPVGKRDHGRRADDKGGSVRVPAERFDELMAALASS